MSDRRLTPPLSRRFSLLKMNNIFLLLLTFVISGAEPFLGSFSLAAIWAGILGVKRQDITGAAAVFMLGIVRDVLLINRLGLSSIILLAVWTVAGIMNSKLSKAVPSSLIAVLGGFLTLSLLETGKIDISGAVMTTILSIATIEIWMWKDSRAGIKVRLSP